jgi:hypothetical protein
MTKRLAEIALSQVGVKEVGGNNRGAKIRMYQSATNLAPAPWAWCAAFVDHCIAEWLKDPATAFWLDLHKTSISAWRPKTAAAFGLLKWASDRPHTTTILPEGSTPQPGDLVVFDFSHCGIVTGYKGGRVLTVEGNTNGRGERDSQSGDGVWAKSRPASLVRNFIRIHPFSVDVKR